MSGPLHDRITERDVPNKAPPEGYSYDTSGVAKCGASFTGYEYDYVRSRGGNWGCGGNDGYKENNRMGACQELFYGPYPDMKPRKPVKGTCYIGGGDERLTCRGINYIDGCPVIDGERGETDWNTPPQFPNCSGSDGHCESDKGCAEIEAAAGDDTLKCTYGPLNTYKRLADHASVFSADRHGNRKRALDAFCELIVPRKDDSNVEELRRVYGDDFNCRLASDGKPAEQCSVYMAEGEAAEMCRKHLKTKTADQKDEIMRRVCRPYRVCQSGENSDDCLVECGCELAAQNEDYQATLSVIEAMAAGSPPRCWWGACMENEKDNFWRNSGHNDDVECPNVCANYIDLSGASAQVIKAYAEILGCGDGETSGGGGGGVAEWFKELSLVHVGIIAAVILVIVLLL